MDRTLQRLNAALETCLWDQLLVIADRIEETGDELLANAYRWLVKQRLLPLWYDNHWWWRLSHGGQRVIVDQLNAAMYGLLPQKDNSWTQSSFNPDAYAHAARWLVSRLDELTKAVEAAAPGVHEDNIPF